MKNLIRTIFLIPLILVFACTGTGNDKKNTDSKYSTPEDQGISSRAILDFVEAIERDQTDQVHSFMLRRHGKIVAQGWWDPFNAESPHTLYSLSKSFTSTAIGIAQDEGLLSIYDPVISFFPGDVPVDTSWNLKDMRVRDLLRMTTGHNQGTFFNLRQSDNWAREFLALEVKYWPGTHFMYNTGATYMLSAIITKVTGEALVDYLGPR